MTGISLIIKKSLHDWHHATLGLILSLSLTLMVTEVFKNTVGRPRPDFIDRCQPVNGSTDASVYGLSTSSICTQTDHALIKDGFKSFISGHSSSFILSLFAYHQYYPALYSHISDKPYSTRLKESLPDYRADFSFHDGSTFEVSVVRRDGAVLHQDSKNFVQSDGNVV
ncbi:13263_t:CDS:2 [Acaulospora colombiana]|uniref:13263_t:CDS:1 n=1 Tax=Acaulospora colombiana TaxID=27376 RepID=A0ACA9KXH2_9GLOM|nr:13263_t:CDS:2 [Acaulospora colombiana]